MVVGVAAGGGVSASVMSAGTDGVGGGGVGGDGTKLAVFSVVSLNDLNEEDADPLVSGTCGGGGLMSRRPMNDLSKQRQTLNNISSEEMHQISVPLKR